MSGGEDPPPPSNLQSFRKNPGYHCHRLLDKVLFQCADDPVGNVHRTWAVLLVSAVIYFALSILESTYRVNFHLSFFTISHSVVATLSAIHLSGGHASRALMIAAIWNGTMQCLGLGLIGTFILKRFPTSFAIGFLLGLVVVCFNQNILFFFAFRSHNRQDDANAAPGGTSRLYNACSLWLALVLAIFGTMLFHFQQYVIVAPIDAKGFGRKTPAVVSSSANNNGAPDSTYQRYNDDGGSES
jgi:hypothetical protein